MIKHHLHRQPYAERIESRVTSYTVTKYDEFCIHCLRSWREEFKNEDCVGIDVRELTRV